MPPVLTAPERDVVPAVLPVPRSPRLARPVFDIAAARRARCGAGANQIAETRTPVRRLAATALKPFASDPALAARAPCGRLTNNRRR